MKLQEFTDRLYDMGGIEQNGKRRILTEARNPENDEVNAVIRKWANSSRNRLSKRDQKILADNGISLEDMTGEYQKKELSGPGRSTGVSGSYPQVLSKEEVKSYHPDADLLGVLSKDRDREEVEYDYPDYKHGDHRMTDSDKSHWLTSGKTKKGAKVKMPTKSQMDALQPYRKEKDELKRAKKEYEKQRERIKDRAEYKRWKRKNESLNLNESKQGLVDYFNELMSTFGVKPYEQVDYLLGYMNESELLDAIDDFKEYMDIDDEDIM